MWSRLGLHSHSNECIQREFNLWVPTKAFQFSLLLYVGHFCVLWKRKVPEVFSSSIRLVLCRFNGVSNVFFLLNLFPLMSGFSCVWDKSFLWNWNMTRTRWEQGRQRGLDLYTLFYTPWLSGNDPKSSGLHFHRQIPHWVPTDEQYLCSSIMSFNYRYYHMQTIEFEQTFQNHNCLYSAHSNFCCVTSACTE